MITVRYHADDYYDVPRPAINVKLLVAGYVFWPSGWAANPPGTSDREAIVETAYERVQSDFWQGAQEIALERGLGEIAQKGRSGGWLVFTDGRDPDDMTGCYYHGDECDDPEDVEHVAARKADRLEWLDGYRAMTEWADEWIAAAPARVAALAQSLAMDAAGERAAYRMFATELLEG